MNTEELPLEVVKNRAVRGIATLTGRTFLIQIISLVATFILTIFLDPVEYGFFFLVSAIINFFAYFSDVGLAAALIQKKEGLTEEDLKTTFTVQQTLAISILIVVFLLTPFLKNWYGMSEQTIFLFWALALSLLLSSLKTIPSVLLERNLYFGKLVIPQIVETVAFNATAVLLAVKGFGIASFTYAVVIRGLAGLGMIYFLAPWRPGLAFSKSSLKNLFRFGLPYQLNTFLAVLKDDGMVALLGFTLGAGGIGLLGWAQKWAASPLRFFMDQVIKVTFPAFSRLQDNQKELSNSLSKSILFISIMVFPSLVILVLLSPILIDIVPRYKKWEPALLALYLICINSAFAAITTPLTNLLNAIGKINITFRLMLMWTVLTWLLIPILSLRYGVSGAAFGYLLVSLSSIVGIVVATRFVSINFWVSIIKPLLAAIAMGIMLFLVRQLLPTSWISVFILAVIGVISYLLLVVLLYGTSIILDLKTIYRSLRQKN